ncbi:CcoQ/FixQ family Cbb3-type cytochrome c oxidase assembly chaperone [Thiohalocapsa halophila]|jgi:cytochrome c oxidase cbb3-type subunit 4|uniref:CcoQ/FixQ family Cbb3-type cytochrome c oxidase assembly chaperone n=1 Tax=Thiohalocapsa halophila TaxID=69359 RepID=A0ABS1CBS3_9GAMM|nr:cbb3-type cytochrome c oxidase subunit 3 [Thiohalocapsa halophila]MBK1629376.1 CcoQ/FixQ family Cbb3-type cytochrome c oxidase assembly chaperone [Thiohalocapsa halophila]
MSDYFKTDWGAMTPTDWVGLILTVVIFVLMVVAYFQVFRPKHRDKLESRKHIPFDEDLEDLGDNDGGK